MGKVLGVIGSMGRDSHTAKAVSLVLKAAEQAGAETDLIDLRKDSFPIFNPDASRDSPVYTASREKILRADAILLGSPDYHGSMSGTMKNFLDYFWKELAGRVYGYVCASHEKGLTPMDQMRTAIRQCYGWSMPYGIGFNGDSAFDTEGSITDERLKSRLESYGYDIARYGTLIHTQFKNDLEGDSVPGFAQHYR